MKQKKNLLKRLKPTTYSVAKNNCKEEADKVFSDELQQELDKISEAYERDKLKYEEELLCSLRKEHEEELFRSIYKRDKLKYEERLLRSLRKAYYISSRFKF